MRKNRARFSAVLWAAGVLLGGLPAQAEGLPKRFEFGRIPLGADVDKLPRWATKSDCKSASNPTSCDFYDPEGVRYNVFDGYICTKKMRVDSTNKHRLPYGIRFEGKTSEIVTYVSRTLKVEFEKNDSRTFIAHELAPEVFDGSAIILRFDNNNRLASIELWSLCT